MTVKLGLVEILIIEAEDEDANEDEKEDQEEDESEDGVDFDHEDENDIILLKMIMTSFFLRLKDCDRHHMYSGQFHALLCCFLCFVHHL